MIPNELGEREVFAMELRDLLPIIDTEITVVVDGNNKEFSSKTEITEELKKHEAKSINVKNNRLIITLGEIKKVPTLEELGYSFDVGV